MTDREILEEINRYSEEVLKDIDPQKTLVSIQLEKLKPIMEEISKKTGISIEDIFIKYMDMASTQKIEMDEKLKQTMADAGVTDLGKLPF